mgnify:CR=1 FL=1
MNAMGIWAKDFCPPVFNATVYTWKPGYCYNYGESGHTRSDCPKPTNQPLFDANLQACKEWKRTIPRLMVSLVVVLGVVVVLAMATALVEVMEPKEGVEVVVACPSARLCVMANPSNSTSMACMFWIN